MDVVANSQRVSAMLEVQADPTKSNVDNTERIGATLSANLPAGTVAFSVSATMGATGEEMELNPLTGVASTSDNGVAQVESISITGTAVGTGTADVALTSALLPGGVVEVDEIPITNGMDGDAVCEAIANLIDSTISDIYENFSVTDPGTVLRATALVAAANDGTLAWAVSFTGVTGLTVGASTNTTAGSPGVVVATNEGDGKDFEGKPLPTLSDNPAVLIVVREGRVIVSDGADYSIPVRAISETVPGFGLIAVDALDFAGPLTITCDEGPADFDILPSGTPA